MAEPPKKRARRTDSAVMWDKEHVNPRLDHLLSTTLEKMRKASLAMMKARSRAILQEEMKATGGGQGHLAKRRAEGTAADHAIDRIESVTGIAKEIGIETGTEGRTEL